MQLAAIEMSKIIYLTQLYRPTGQLYIPEAIAKIVQRYSFVKHPSIEDLTKNVQTFGVGKFENSQIQEMSVYNDGVIASASSNTNIIDAFLSDVLTWSKENLGLIQAVTAKPEKHYESNIVIKSKVDMTNVAKPRLGVLQAFNKIWKRGYFGNAFVPASFNLDCDKSLFRGLRKPIHFGFERRVGVPFEENIFHSTAPLTTDDHLDLLERLEALAEEI